MKNLIGVAGAMLVMLTPAAYLGAHCEVPCGIYDDAARFASMHEDYETVKKSMANIRELTYDMESGPEPLTANQLIRWVTTKEDHATKTQHTIAQYFMTQRIKADDPKYVEKLTAAHAVMVAAMKCEQSVDASVAEDLHQAIDAFQKAYTGEAAH